MRFGVDLDGVLANFNDEFSQYANTIWPGRYPPGYQATDWNFGGMSQSDQDKVWAKIKAVPNFWLALKPYRDNVWAIARHRLLYPEDEIFYVTARVPTDGMPVAHQSQRWLSSVGIFGLGCAVIVKAEHKEDKHSIYTELHVDAIVDDKLAEIHINKAKGGPHLPVLLDRPWNQEDRIDGITVVRNLEEFFERSQKSKRVSSRHRSH